MKKHFILLSFLVVFTFISINHKIFSQSVSYRYEYLGVQQEKIYLHTDKKSYISGETIWYRAYLVDASLHYGSMSYSNHIFVDLIDPLGDIVSESRIIRDQDGVFANSITVDETLPQGFYTLRAYTYQMVDSPQLAFTKEIFIASMELNPIKISYQIDSIKGSQYNVSLSFKDMNTNELLKVEEVKIVEKDRQPQYLRERNEKWSYRFDRSGSEPFLIEYILNGRFYKEFLNVRLDDSADYDVTFHPEGGYLLDQDITVGFKAINNQGLGEKVSGSLYDSRDDLILTFTSDDFGMGKFDFTPKPEERYYVICSNARLGQKKIEMPEVNSSAVGLNCRWEGDSLLVNLREGSKVSSENEYILVMHTRGLVFCAGSIASNSTIGFPKTIIPTGVVHAVLMDMSFNPISERLLFCYKEEDSPDVSVISDKKYYAKRDHVLMDIGVDIPWLDDITGDFSVSVTDDKDILVDGENSLLSYLLLSSDLKGNIESPHRFFENYSDENIDVLMLTQGWRRYEVSSYLKNEPDSSLHYINKDEVISGRITNFVTRKPVSNIPTFVHNLDAGIMLDTTTDADGRFEFPPVRFRDSTALLIQAMGSRKKRIYDITADTLKKLKIVNSAKASFIEANELVTEDHLKKHHDNYIQEYGELSYVLKQAVISSERIEHRTGDSFQYKVYTSRLNRVITSEMLKQAYYSPEVIFLRLGGGVRMLEDGTVMIGNMRDAYMNPIPAAIVIDDFLVQSKSVTDIDFNNVESIEIFDGGSAAIFGSRGLGGVLSFRMKKGGSDVVVKDPNFKEIRPLGFKDRAVFYSPKYETTKEKEDKTIDYRTTIYWNPSVKITEGKGQFDFYTADMMTNYSVLIEGITSEGKIFRKLTKIEVR